MSAMATIDLGELHWSWPQRVTRVLLLDGPCAGTWAEAPERELWQRVGKPGGSGVETQMWARYDYSAPGTHVYSGVTINTDQLRDALAALVQDGHEFGESYGC